MYRSWLGRALVSSLVGLAVSCTTGGPQPPVFPSGQNRAELQLDAQDNGRTIGIQAGETFALTLAVEQPDWTLSQQPDPNMATFVSRTRTGSTEVWTFRGTGPGTTQFELSSGAPEPFSLIVSVT
jgi:hypothetical protein